jgi:phosphoribosylaminoimidazole-succinocarboxamide synthase
MNTITQIEIPGIKKLRSGKVREIFDLGDALLFVATDRISAFDVIMPNPIPEKGFVLTALSAFWFKQTAHIVLNHFLTNEFERIMTAIGERATCHADTLVALRDRSMLVRKCRPLPVECVVRGYLAGSGWKEYQQNGTVCGITLPTGLVESAKLQEPIFTPSTKAETGHDENISFDRACEILGKPLAETVRHYSLALYRYARDYAARHGIIIADTKFEFGMDHSKLLLIDEALTPDSSRFWPFAGYKPGGPQPSFDKQFLRDYLETLNWNKTPPGPQLPPDIIQKTSAKYLEALQRLAP